MSNKLAETSHSLMEHAAHSADAAIHGTQRLANQASDKTIAYIRDEPVKSMLIAAATGAALVALARLIGRPNSPY